MDQQKKTAVLVVVLLSVIIVVLLIPDLAQILPGDSNIKVRLNYNDDMNNLLQKTETIHLPKGEYSGEIIPEKGPVEKISFTQLKIPGSEIKLNIDDVPEDIPGPVHWDEVYAIDPSDLDFEFAEFSAVAKAPELYKCKDWDFEARDCKGEWVFYKNLVVGEKYVVELGPLDPGFGEGDSSGDIWITNPEYDVPGGIVTISGTGFTENSTVELDITGPSEVTNYPKNISTTSEGNITDFWAIPDNQTSGDYNLSAIDNINSSLNDSIVFEVKNAYTKIKEDDTFDAIIDVYDKDENNTLTVVFHHDSLNNQPIEVKGNVNYTLDKNSSISSENVTLLVYNWTGQYFRIIIGEATESYEFGEAQTRLFNTSIKDASNSDVNATIVIKDHLTNEVAYNNTGVSHSYNVLESNYDIEIIPQNSIVTGIVINDTEIFTNLNRLINIDDPANNSDYNELYAVDPTNLSFDEVTINVVATGSVLYKCTSWNFTNQSCPIIAENCVDDPDETGEGNQLCDYSGGWEFVKDLTPGEEYTYVLIAGDPGFAEGTPSEGTPDGGSYTFIVSENNQEKSSGTYVNAQADDSSYYCTGYRDSDSNGENHWYTYFDYNVSHLNLTSLDNLTFEWRGYATGNDDSCAPANDPAECSDGHGNCQASNIKIYDWDATTWDDLSASTYTVTSSWDNSQQTVDRLNTGPEQSWYDENTGLIRIAFEHHETGMDENYETYIITDLAQLTVGYASNEAPTTPTSITCDGGSCNNTFSGDVDINCSGSTDSDNDTITYVIDAYYNTTACSNDGDCGSCSVEGDCVNCSIAGCSWGGGGSNTITYYFDSYSASNWDNNPENAVDGSISTEANTNDDGYYIAMDDSTAPGTNLGTITSVETRVYFKNNYVHSSLSIVPRLIPYFNGSSQGDNHNPTPGDYSTDAGYPDWSDWYDITDDTNAPGTWSWTDVQNLDMRVEAYRPSAGRVYVYKVELRVNYTTTGCSGTLDCTQYSDQTSCETCDQCTWGSDLSWHEIGNHTTGVYTWDISNIDDQTNVDLRCRAIDNGSNTYSDYYDPAINLTISGANNPPTHSTPILNSTSGTNETMENITCYNQSTADSDEDAVKNIYHWTVDGNTFESFLAPFDTSNNTIKDYSDNSFSMTVNGATWSNNTGYDDFGAYEFDGENDYINVSASSLDTTNGLTVMGWFKPVGPNGAWQNAFNRGDPDSGWGHWSIAFNQNNGWVVWQFQNSTGNTRFVGHYGDALYDAVDDWVFVAGVFDGTTAMLIASNATDGSLFSKNSTDYAGQGIYDSSADIRIGTINITDGSSDFFNGTSDDLRVYDRALTYNQIREIYENNTHKVISETTSYNEEWVCYVTPTDTLNDGTTLSSNSLTILDTVAPVIDSVGDTPDPVDAGQTINITVNITEGGELDSVLVEIDGVNNSMTLSGTTWYYDEFNTSAGVADAGLYNYSVYANDTAGNDAIPQSSNFTINALVTMSLTSAPINFTNVSAGGTVNAQAGAGWPLTTTNNGNVPVSLKIKGWDLIGQTNGSYSIDVSRVHWSLTSSFSTETNLTNSFTLFNSSVSISASEDLYFKLYAPLGIISQNYKGNVSILAEQI